MTNGNRIIVCIAKLCLCVLGLLMLYELTTHKPMQSPELLYSYLIWSLPPVLVLVLAGVWARCGSLRSLQARARRTLGAWE